MVFWRVYLKAVLLTGALCLPGTLVGQTGGFDTGMDAPEALARWVEPFALETQAGVWLRIRDLAEQPEQVEAHRRALTVLRERGFKVCVLLNWPEASWRGGVRVGPGRRLPCDLREAFERCRTLATRYAGLVDAWEVENEPDISFCEDNAEDFAAFFKTCALGLREGHAAVSGTVERLRKERLSEAEKPFVVLAPMALPPGRYFERLWRNGVGGYTDAFNFHYYGYAEDAQGVYLQFGDALASVAEGELAKEVPVIVTEYGYGSLSERAAATSAGRERQQRWFVRVSEQLREAGAFASMAFVVAPYLEDNTTEFGLMRKHGDGWSRTPAFDSVWSAANEKASAPRALSVRQDPISPLVIDFLPGEGLTQRKSFGGYVVEGYADDGRYCGHGALRVYNFSGREARGVLELSSTFSSDGSKRRLEIVLSAGAGEIFPVELWASGERFDEVEVSARCEMDTGEGRMLATTWSTTVFPSVAAMRAMPVERFDHNVADAAVSRKILAERVLAAEEPRLRENGRWWASEGVAVEEREGLWSFRVMRFPDEPGRPAMAELPLSEGFRLERTAMLTFRYRAEAAGAAFDVYFRTANGNLYQVWPRRNAGSEWAVYGELGLSFSLAFYGRAELPWRFLDNQPVALVFFFRPSTLPAVYEIKDAAVVKWQE